MISYSRDDVFHDALMKIQFLFCPTWRKFNCKHCYSRNTYFIVAQPREAKLASARVTCVRNPLAWVITVRLLLASVCSVKNNFLQETDMSIFRIFSAKFQGNMSKVRNKILKIGWSVLFESFFFFAPKLLKLILWLNQ